MIWGQIMKVELSKIFDSKNYVSFIVDLPDIGQSYRVYYEWSDSEDNPYIIK